MEEEKKTWRILEFYSGIGAMRYSLQKAGVNGHVVEAFDINDVANDVYQRNFGHRPFQGNIQTLTANDLDKYGAHVWLLSPPCQPYTRQGLKKDSADARAFSFITILELVPKMSKPPLMLFVENVVGFETSNTHEQMMKVLSRIGFITQEFILSPLQFGVPYSRPRYFCLGKREPLLFQDPLINNLLLRTPSPFMEPKDAAVEIRLDKDNDCNDELSKQCEPILNFLDTRQNINHKVGEEVEDGAGCSPMELFSVPESLIERWGSAMDIVYPESRRCCCFTKSYYRYVKGTGSLLATSEVTESEQTDKSNLKHLGLRFFTPREIANLHSLPADFDFPPHIALRQQYALLGNSMSVAVVAPLLHYLFSDPT